MIFERFPKIPRLFRDIVITEKIDGTNSAVCIEELGEAADSLTQDALAPGDFLLGGKVYQVSAQSRKRLISPVQGDDNFGFAQWVRDNGLELARLLGPGRHFGEWWGKGIQRGYGLSHRKFSLFNPEFHFLDSAGSGLLYNEIDTVPVLYRGAFDTQAIRGTLDYLAMSGSQAAPGFKRPEGIIVWHDAARQAFKVTVEHDEAPKASIHWGGDGA